VGPFQAVTVGPLQAVIPTGHPPRPTHPGQARPQLALDPRARRRTPTPRHHHALLSGPAPAASPDARCRLPNNRTNAAQKRHPPIPGERSRGSAPDPAPPPLIEELLNDWGWAVPTNVTREQRSGTTQLDPDKDEKPIDIDRMTRERWFDETVRADSCRVGRHRSRGGLRPARIKVASLALHLSCSVGPAGLVHIESRRNLYTEPRSPTNITAADRDEAAPMLLTGRCISTA
jgi:hypothetical protein